MRNATIGLSALVLSTSLYAQSTTVSTTTNTQPWQADQAEPQAVESEAEYLPLPIVRLDRPSDVRPLGDEEGYTATVVLSNRDARGFYQVLGLAESGKVIKQTWRDLELSSQGYFANVAERPAMRGEGDCESGITRTLSLSQSMEKTPRIKIYDFCAGDGKIEGFSYAKQPLTDAVEKAMDAKDAPALPIGCIYRMNIASDWFSPCAEADIALVSTLYARVEKDLR
jgi:hypothetical protein